MCIFVRVFFAYIQNFYGDYLVHQDVRESVSHYLGVRFTVFRAEIFLFQREFLYLSRLTFLNKNFVPCQELTTA